MKEEDSVDNQNRLYNANEMAKIASAHCDGCGGCCRNMGESIRLDPLDVHELSFQLGQPFSDLLETVIGLHVEDGIILPHLLMKNQTEAGGEEAEECVFLGRDSRCDIHAFRPGLCRLFPLGRDYDGTGFRYFIVPDGCDKTDKTKVRIEKWLGVTEIEPYESFIADWHYFIKDMKAKVASMTDATVVKEINLKVLEEFYQTPYDPMRNFYLQFAMRLRRAKRLLEGQ